MARTTQSPLDESRRLPVRRDCLSRSLGETDILIDLAMAPDYSMYTGFQHRYCLSGKRTAFDRVEHGLGWHYRHSPTGSCYFSPVCGLDGASRTRILDHDGHTVCKELSHHWAQSNVSTETGAREKHGVSVGSSLACHSAISPPFLVLTLAERQSKHAIRAPCLMSGPPGPSARTRGRSADMRRFDESDNDSV